MEESQREKEKKDNGGKKYMGSVFLRQRIDLAGEEGAFLREDQGRKLKEGANGRSGKYKPSLWARS